MKTLKAVIVEDARLARNELKELLNNKSISEETIIFNNLVKTKIDYMNNWESNLKNSWLSRFIK